MPQLTQSGFFITFEGIDGIGKTKQLQMLKHDLVDKINRPMYVTKEPGDNNHGSSLGPGVRSLVFKDPGSINLTPGVVDLLFLADHLQNTADIKQALSKDSIVLSDRYADSQFAYCSVLNRRAQQWATDLYKELYGPIPDLIILFVAYDLFGVSNNNPDDISWVLDRAKNRVGSEAGKQDGKSWSFVEDQFHIQNAYLKNMKERTNQGLDVLLVNVSPTSSPETIHDIIFTKVYKELRDRRLLKDGEERTSCI
jgi:dTMP kinase